MSTNKQRKGVLGTEWLIISKKTIYKAIGAVLGLIVLIIAGYSLKVYIQKIQESGFNSSHSARFLRLEGRVMIKRANTGAVVPATTDISLEPGDTIQTGSDSSALVEYEDGSRYTIKPGSTIILKENFNNAKRVVSQLEKGNLKVTTPENSGRHIVGTSTGTRAEFASGTDVGITSGDSKTTVVVGRGLATIFTSQGEQKLVANQRLDVDPQGVKQSELLPAPTLGVPENAKQLLIEQNQELEFSWTAVNDASSYKIIISPNVSFPEQALTVNVADLTQTKYIWKRPIPGNFFWHVQAIAKDGVEGNWSEPRSFIVKFKKVNGDLPLRITKTNEINYFLVEVEGVTKPGVILTINDRDTEVDAKGNFKYALTFPPNTRERTITIEAQDSNGNTKTLVQKL